MPMLYRSILILCCSLCALASSAHADDADSSARELSVLRLGIVGGATVGGFVYGHVLQSNLWWKGEQSAFHFNWQDDWQYALGADKLGHFFFPYIVTDLYYNTFLWTGMDTTTSLYVASGLALTYQTYVEVKDGFSKQWGFSWGDFAADALGAAFPIAQHHIPALRPYSMKVSFFPSEQFKAGKHSVIFDDYESTYHWLSVDVHSLLPPSWQSAYPAWLNLALGHTVSGLDGMGGGTHNLYLGLDWNLKALPIDGWLWDVVTWITRYYHLPAPAVRLYPSVVWYGIVW